MKISTIVATTCAAIMIAGSAAAHDGRTETVTPKFDQAIPNIPGKSLVVLEVDYAQGAASGAPPPTGSTDEVNPYAAVLNAFAPSPPEAYAGITR